MFIFNDNCKDFMRGIPNEYGVYALGGSIGLKKEWIIYIPLKNIVLSVLYYIWSPIDFDNSFDCSSNF